MACATRTGENADTRHLTTAAAVAALRRGASIEQFLGGAPVGAQRVVRWLTIVRLDQAHYQLRLHEVEDIGNPEFLDVTEFPPVAEDEYIGEGRVLAVQASPEEALAFAEARAGTTPDRWVNAGMVCDEYGDYLSEGRDL